MDVLVKELRAHQEAHPELGNFYTAMHTFADRLIERFYKDTVEMGYPVISLSSDSRTRMGHYSQLDGYMMQHAINLNPKVLRGGEEAAETLAHELVHLWQHIVGRPCLRNYHSAEFHRRMWLYGIETSGSKGQHKNKTAEWLNWMDENDDLLLDSFILPGRNLQPRRQLLKFQCPECGNPVRSRKYLNLICGDCESEYELVSTRNKKTQD